MKLTPTQRRMVALLADGEPHPLRELRKMLYDEQGSATNVYYHIHMIRKELPDGEEIVCRILNRQSHYQHVRLLRS